ncbi:hypothetical protein PVAND_007861 [Polypedilum vanderplanki]|uniref:Lysosome membrane protein 2 n=1 Tax=Polypedilum vanderplanki TaxID=319348 RepID=A0A9J6C8H1_POLVA|nr:hypothetical protein PVAND_007861 [Polypedilum vanderplanki]
MGLHKNYLKVGQNASQMFGIPRVHRGSTPLSMLISYGAKFNSNRCAVIVFGIITLIAGVILASVPWLNYFILKNLRLWNDTLSFHYWQRPGVIRLTKVYIFNVTNPEGFLNGEKPKLVELGPFVYREDMEKVNIHFHDNHTVSYQHKKILQFVPELSVDGNMRITTPNIPLLTLSTQSKNLNYFLKKGISLALTAANYKPFASVTADELVFGYDDTLVALAHRFYPRDKRPLAKMGLLNGNLRFRNDTLSFHYWQRPGVIRLTKVYIFNVTNPEGFLNGEKPKLVELGPFVYREDMEKVNIHFHDNHTVSYQHKKILQFVPELSVDGNMRITTPNIPLLTLSTQSKNLNYFLKKGISLALTAANYKPFASVTADELVFGYDDTLVALAHRFYPRDKRPLAKMGLLNGRNGTLAEVSTINTGSGENGMQKFGYLDRLNGLDRLPYWRHKPCNNISASEGSFFPPRDITKANRVHVYDKDLCRIIPLDYVKPVVKDGIDADLYMLPRDAFGGSNKDNQCFNEDDYEAEDGLQNISPCQYGAPVYISNPHFYESNPKFLAEVEGLNPQKELHETYFKIQPRLGVPVEGKVRVQLNLRVEQAPAIKCVEKFRDFVFPIMWLEEGISELTPPIRRWIYLGTVFAPTAIPLLSYGMIVGGAFIIIFVFVHAYKNFVFATDPTIEILEMGRRSLRRGSSLLINGQHHILSHRNSYHLLKEPKTHHISNNHNNKHLITPMKTINSSSSNYDEESIPSS